VDEHKQPFLDRSDDEDGLSLAQARINKEQRKFDGLYHQLSNLNILSLQYGINIPTRDLGQVNNEKK
jgi:carbohydrate-selective porin OprB